MRLLARQPHPAQDPRLSRSLATGFHSAPETDTIYFDASCGMCSASARRLKRLVSPHGFALAPLQDPHVSEILGLKPREIPDEMKLRTRDGAILGGVDAIVYICRRIWWAWPVWAVSNVPGVMPILRRMYRMLATNRHRITFVCRI